jgi:TRAP-type C4-dicarboxylate transport system permease small subunit
MEVSQPTTMPPGEPGTMQPDAPVPKPAPDDLLGRLALALALVGGFLLLAIVAVEIVSVVGGVFGRPLLGDTEIIEILSGIAITCFMPYCQLQGGNVLVDFFTARCSQRTRDLLDAVMQFVSALVIAVITWRLLVGGWAQYDRGRVSMFLLLPQWWGYAGAGTAAIVWTLACFTTALRKLRSVLGAG